jgi:hypothetical protein
MILRVVNIIWHYGIHGIIQISKFINICRTYVTDGVFPVINFT